MSSFDSESSNILNGFRCFDETPSWSCSKGRQRQNEILDTGKVRLTDETPDGLHGNKRWEKSFPSFRDGSVRDDCISILFRGTCKLTLTVVVD